VRDGVIERHTLMLMLLFDDTESDDDNLYES